MDALQYDAFRLVFFGVGAVVFFLLAWETYKHLFERKNDTLEKIKELMSNEEPKSANEKLADYDALSRRLVRYWTGFVVMVAVVFLSMQYMIPSMPKMSKRSTSPTATTVDKAPDNMVAPIKRTLTDAEREKANQEKYDANKSHVPTGQ